MLAGLETRAPDRTGMLHYASNAMLERIPGIGSTIYEREQVERERERGSLRGMEKRNAKETRGLKREEGGGSERGAS